MTERKRILAMTPDRALEYAAWRCFLMDAPKKYEDNEITYIPIDDETRELAAGELGLKYDLLPAIARLAFDAIHGKHEQIE